jgi:hypothetical protein
MQGLAQVHNLGFTDNTWQIQEYCSSTAWSNILCHTILNQENWLTTMVAAVELEEQNIVQCMTAPLYRLWKAFVI